MPALGIVDLASFVSSSSLGILRQRISEEIVSDGRLHEGVAAQNALLLERMPGQFLGVNRKAYPHHFSGLARYHADMQKSVGIKGAPLSSTWENFRAFLDGRQGEDKMTLNTLHTSDAGAD